MMKLYHVSLALFAGLGLVAGQGMDSLPPCARDCATGSIPKTCKAIDVNCICSDKSFITGISCCVASTCSAEDQTSALNFAQQICGGAGVTDLPQSASCTSGNTASATLQTTGTTTGASATTTSTGAANGTRLDSSSSASAANATKTGSNTQSVKTQGATATDKNAASNATASSAAGIILGDSSAGLAAILGAAFYALLL
ncbi:CFEM domain-containing protein [Aspergillus neoniger CBS 115656]|uniref:CFEM domain-containing protein n=2 Tax=Aspergillus subgen. Circumdati TaxID=2720871 RepID=A0A318Y757_ASPNB|nr:hypothetical protein BO87DRAFT_344263 [Aspergillus neoniger CBS 115656]XP_025534094.1 hypothetical protein BO79DRAFT_241339 [Aspergillus costaricaensis CBS 115574]PYH29724.1 hypothetical protein BO87DRAFT_344263 [Aspergillus neoniger CBS 115656]RAK83259.1 hypothetical protein BO79DRAFT_241339 [Aspergillus costaricaensis CBS 115574]